MKKFLSDLKTVFSYLIVASVIAIGAGFYLSVTLGLAQIPPVALFAAAGMLLWAAAWGEFMTLCLHLRRGESAFTQETGHALRAIGFCMVLLAALTLACIALRPFPTSVLLGLPISAVFLAAALAAKVLLGLLEHAMALEKEQEGVV